jgi:hypothetical protein
MRWNQASAPLFVESFSKLLYVQLMFELFILENEVCQFQFYEISTIAE